MPILQIHTLHRRADVRNFNTWVPNFVPFSKDDFPFWNSVGSLCTYWKICGFPGTHGTHAIVDPALWKMHLICNANLVHTKILTFFFRSCRYLLICLRFHPISTCIFTIIEKSAFSFEACSGIQKSPKKHCHEDHDNDMFDLSF